MVFVLVRIRLLLKKNTKMPDFGVWSGEVVIVYKANKHQLYVSLVPLRLGHS